jgi:HAD superfamily hydrolase (TIGR01459 family)
MPTPSTSMPIIASIRALSADTDAWISDIWGVLHNGVASFPAACDACIAYRKQGGVIVLLTNAPRPSASVIAQMDGLGVPRTAYDDVVTSGDLTRRLIAKQKLVPGHTELFHLGPDRDHVIYKDLGVTLIGPEKAKLVVCSGYFNDEVETPGDYADMLQVFRTNDAVMICANPDLVVERGHRIVHCAGGIAAAYEQVGGTVLYAGKPHLPAYDLAYELIAKAKGAPVPKDRILAIGDGLKTDIKGAANAGLRCVFVASAIHVRGALDADKLAALFPDFAVTPVAAHPIAAMDALVW